MTHAKLGVTAAADYILRCRRVLILCHTNPDGDTLGSAQALRRLITLTGGFADVAVPSNVPERLDFLADGVISSPDADLYSEVIAVDVASVGQLGRFSDLAPRVGLMIDHHRSGEAFADSIIMPDASAAGGIIFEIYSELKERGAVTPDAEVARYLFAAISSDTGSFKFSNTTPYTFMAAAVLSSEIAKADDGGPDTADISRLLHDTVTEKELRISVDVSKKITLYEDGALAVCRITADDIRRLGADDSDFGGAIDVVRSLRGVIVAVTLRQKKDGSDVWKISARSTADVDVAKVLSAFGGGGHLRAAGATLNCPGDEAYEKVVSAFRRAVAKYKARHGE